MFSLNSFILIESNQFQKSLYIPSTGSLYIIYSFSLINNVIFPLLPSSILFLSNITFTLLSPTFSYLNVAKKASSLLYTFLSISLSIV